MRKFFQVSFVLAAMLVLASSAFALEKVSVRMTDEDLGGGWTAGTTCSVSYFNTCTGWLWIWSGWSSGDQVGVQYDNCCPSGSGTLDAAGIFAWTGAPTGYGFTGVAKLVDDTNGDTCPDEGAIATQPYLPISGWNTYLWGEKVGSSFITVFQHGVSAFPNPIAYATDHPAAGPTGPVSCGTCFPTTRTNHSFFYGTKNSPLCPGSPLNDGVCDAEFFAFAALTCNPISVEERTWGQIKNLYR